jgi:N-methylhydantoinase A
VIRIAFDIGGTFTDFVLEDAATGALRFGKAATTPKSLEQAVLEGCDAILAAHGAAAGDVSTVLHATTVATNAILERKGAPTALVTTAGFRDILIIGRQKRYDTNNMHLDKPHPLIERRHIFEVTERVAADGAVVTALDPASLEDAIAALRRGGYASVAVALINAFANPAHEAAVAKTIAAGLPGIPVTASHEVSPRIREYERTSTTVANAYVRPIVERYLASLDRALAARGFAANLWIMQSNGGLVTPDLARELPVRIVESGPAAGVLMCAAVGREEAAEHVLTFDMGGTTAKLGAVDGGEPAIMPSFEVDGIDNRRYSGLPLSVPAVELVEIGAGGGSIAMAHRGLVKVGPESAGAEPGPACYGRGGHRATITDANLVLGYLDPGWFCGGTMALDTAAARAAIERDVATPLGLSIEEAAWGVHRVANANMERAMRIVSIERGRDPRRYALVAFGGAGPLHACRLARSLGVPRVIVPVGAGVGSAIGLLAANARLDATATRIMAIADGNEAAIAEVLAGLERRVQADVDRLGSAAQPTWRRGAYMRYVGQGYEIRVELPEGPIDTTYPARMRGAFADTYARTYGYADPDARVEAVDWTVVATVPGEVSNRGAAWRRLAGAESVTARATRPRRAWFPEAGGMVEAAVVDRYGLAHGAVVVGPALIEEREATTVVLPGDRVTLTENGHLSIDVGRG